MKKSALLQHLAAANLQTVTLSAGDTDILITPHGGRVLGLFTHASADNLFYTNPELQSPASAKKFLAGEHVLGGDRLWIAPERGLFFKGNRLEDGVVTQPSIDPGNWAIGSKAAHAIRFVNEFSVEYFHIRGSRVRGIVEKSIRLAANPLPTLPQNVRYAGYETASRFELCQAPDDHLHFGMWFLIQLVVPKGGFLYAPTSGKAVITGDYYEPTGPDYLRVAETHVRFKLDSIDRHKIGIRKNEVLGRAAFLSNPGGAGANDATLVVRNFLNNPSAFYSDVPLHTPAGTQDSIQSYNHNTGPSGFGELEFHSPGITRAMPEPVVTDLNQVWAFTGPREALVPIAAYLLNLPPSTFDA